MLGLPAFKDEQLELLSDAVAELPYQLLAAIAGTLLEADLQQAGKAVFIVHEFRTNKTVERKMTENAQVLNGFLRLLNARNVKFGKDFELVSGQLIGPLFMMDGDPCRTLKIPYDIPLFIGKIRTDGFDAGLQTAPES